MLCVVNKTEKVEEVAPEIIAATKDVQAKKEIYAPYNILPLDSAGGSQSIMQFEEVDVGALLNTCGLNWPTSFDQQRKKSGELDVLDWLRAMFGFQRDNVRNQREHLTLLLANVRIRLNPKPKPLNKLNDRAVDVVMNKLFKNYKTWCKYLGRKHNLWLPQGQQEVQQRKILYMGLNFLIWGEATNVRFMPECLCYIFHNMAYELHGLLAGNFSIISGENIKPSYGGDDESFMRKVITPIYRIIDKEAKKSKNGKAPHTAWCGLIASLWVGLSVMMVISSNQHMTHRENTVRIKILETRENHISPRPVPFGIRFEVMIVCGHFLYWQYRFIMAWMERQLVDLFMKDVLYDLSNIFITATLLRFLQMSGLTLMKHC